MELNYTKLAILLLRLQGVITILSWIPQAHIAYFYIFSDSDFTKGVPNYAISILLQPIIGIVFIVFSIPIARRVAALLNQNEN
jgi:hypothetical protein